MKGVSNVLARCGWDRKHAIGLQTELVHTKASVALNTTATFPGYYMYAEADGNLFQGNNALLRTKATLGAGTQRCLSFWYYMWGQTMGNLNVNIVNTNYQVIRQAWSSEYGPLSNAVFICGRTSVSCVCSTETRASSTRD